MRNASQDDRLISRFDEKTAALDHGAMPGVLKLRLGAWAGTGGSGKAEEETLTRGTGTFVALPLAGGENCSPGARWGRLVADEAAVPAGQR